jgi:Alr-MurF fusion protein
MIVSNSFLTTTADYLLTDSRQLVFPAQTLFFAIRGERHDGHAFVESLYHQGVRQFVVEQKSITDSFQKILNSLSAAQIWVVEDALKALQLLAKNHRQKFAIPVVAITGSNGKTIVKEWLGQLLADDYHVVRSPKSYNSQIGVPLSVWQMNSSHSFGIFEVGMSRPHEIEILERIIQPTIGIFTNIGSAHDEGFRSRKQKITEKLKLFTHCQKLIYCADYQNIDQEIQLILKAVNPNCKLIGWKKVSSEKCIVISEKRYARPDLKSGRNTATDLQSQGEPSDTVFQTHFTDPASIENLTHCVVLMLELGIEPAEIQLRINRLKPVSMRLELKQGINNCVLIDDSYNNDLAGLTMALGFLNQQQQRSHKTLILSDLLQTGQKENELYQQIADLVQNKSISQFIAIGPAFERNRELFDSKTAFFKSTSDFLSDFSTKNLQNNIVLIKGARIFKFERIVNALQQKIHGTVLEINLDALTQNLNYYRSQVGATTQIMAMVKAFGYGGGSVEIAQLLQFHRVNYLAVAYADEGVTLRDNGITLPIMIMNPSPDSFDKLVDNQLEPEIYSHSILDQWLHHAGKVHLKLDTGMHRLGFVEADLPLLISKLQSSPNLQVVSVFSHLVGADEAQHNGFSKLQYDRLVAWSDQIETAIGYKLIRHILNSAGIIRFPDYKLDMVRLGIGLYGVEVNQQAQDKLRQVGTLKTVISQIKYLKAGETVGYGRMGKIDRDTTIATIAIGYADGYDRRFGNSIGQVLVNGMLCPTVGKVCMDMTMIDVSAVGDVQEGNEVIVFGEDLPITTLAHNIDTIPYEILTGVSERVKRVFFKE